MLRQRNRAQVKEQIKTPKIELIERRQPTYQIQSSKHWQSVREVIEYNKLKEGMKAIQSEVKKNMQGTNSEGKEARIQINYLEQKEEITIQSQQKEETRTQ